MRKKRTVARAKQQLTPGRAEPTGRRRLTPDARQRELIEAGIEVLRDKGIAARVEDVTSAAKAAKGTFYVYYPTWGDFLREIRREADAMVGERFEELSKAYPDWRSLIAALSRLHVQLVRNLEGLDVIYRPAFATQIGEGPDQNLDRLIFFFNEAARAGAIDLEDPERTGRLVYGMILQTTNDVLAGDDEDAACTICGEFIAAGLNARRIKRRKGYWPEP